MIISRTPYRVSLFGGSTDYESFYSQHESLLIGFTIDKYCYIALRKTPNIFNYHTKILYHDIEEVKDNNEIRHNGVRGVLSFLNIKYGIEINHLGDLPAQTGIGSSSAFIVGLLNAIYRLEGISLSKETLAKNAIHIERHILNEYGGIQDQIWSAYGGINSINIHNDGSFEVRPLPVSEKFVRSLLDRSVLVYTGSSRNSFEVAKSHDCANNISFKMNIKKIAEKAYDMILKQDINSVAELLNESWIQKQKISNLISNKHIEEIYALLQSYGMIGGKLLGAGDSGFIFAIMNSENSKNIFVKKYEKYIIPISICNNGSFILNE